MRKILFSCVAVGALAFATQAMSLCTNPAGAAGGAAAGAAAGAAVGGPVGAAVGGVAGAAVGSQALPPTACEYVRTHEVEAVQVDAEVVVGKSLPETVTVYEIPDQNEYVFAYVNDKRVIVNPNDRVVVEVIN